MRATVRADGVPAPSELAYLSPIHKCLRADVIRGDEEMAAPAQFFQPFGDVPISAHPAVVERDRPLSRASCGKRIGYEDRRFAYTTDGLQVLIEGACLQLV